MENYTNTDEQVYRRAKKRARAIRAFYYNLSCYCIVIPVLIAINLIYSPQFYWFIFSALGWGMGLAFHGMGAFNYNPFLGRDWEERKIRELLKKEKSRKDLNQ
jgi:hypothetical protein